MLIVAEILTVLFLLAVWLLFSRSEPSAEFCMCSCFKYVHRVSFCFLLICLFIYYFLFLLGFLLIFLMYAQASKHTAFICVWVIIMSVYTFAGAKRYAACVRTPRRKYVAFWLWRTESRTERKASLLNRSWCNECSPLPTSNRWVPHIPWKLWTCW